MIRPDFLKELIQRLRLRYDFEDTMDTLVFGSVVVMFFTVVPLASLVF